MILMPLHCVVSAHYRFMTQPKVSTIETEHFSLILQSSVSSTTNLLKNILSIQQIRCEIIRCHVTGVYSIFWTDKNHS
jgi:hypothetical protein